MAALFRKKTALDRRRESLRRELSSLDEGIRAASRAAEAAQKAAARPAPPVERPALDEIETPAAAAGPLRIAAPVPPRAAPEPPEPPEPAEQPEPLPPPEARARGWRGLKTTRDERLASYLASSGFDTARPLRHERRIQRNKAIVTLLFAGAVVLWVLRHFVW
jgi:hypothetical protein